MNKKNRTKDSPPGLNPLPEQQTAAKKKKLLSLGALGLSLVIHTTILLLIGGIVLIDGIIPKSVFTSDPEISAAPETPVDQPEPEQDAAQPESTSPPESAAASPVQNTETSFAENLISTDTLSPMQAFTVPPLGSTVAGIGTGEGTQGSGIGKGGDSGGLRKMTNPFGSKGELSNGLVGHFYDLKQTVEGKPTPFANIPGETIAMDAAVNQKFAGVVKDFVKNWNTSVLKGYYQAKDPLTTYQFFMPVVTADSAPKAFDVDKFVQPKRWLIHYKGNVVAPKTGTFRFVGLGDDVLIVRFNNRDVLDASWMIFEGGFNAPDMYGKAFASSTQNLRIGKWISVVEGQSYPMEVLIGEVPGGKFSCFLMAEEKDAKYEDRPNGVKGPRLPVFQTQPTGIPRYKAEEDAPAVKSEGWVFSKNL